jgi:phosphomannomutase
MDGKPFFDSDILKLSDIATSGSFLVNTNDINSELLTYQNISKSYINMLVKMHPEIKNLKVIWDPGNGAVGAHLNDLIGSLTGEHKTINIEVDGTFPNHHPNPSDHKNLNQLIETVLDTNSDLGIAFDGDGDRLGVVDSKGHIITGDALLLIMAKDVLSRHPKSKIIADVKTSDIVFQEIKKIGGDPIIWKTGHSFIKTKMKEESAILAGEMSGHIFFSENYYGFDDAIMAAVKLLSILSKDKNAINDALSCFKDVYSTPELSIECSESEKFKIIDIIKNHLNTKGISFLDIDGVRVQEKDSWWLIRASNTEAKLILRIESRDKEKLSELLYHIKKLLSDAGVNKSALNFL